MAYLPCLNPNCKSHGAPHPNCKCYNLNPSEQRAFSAQNKLLKSHGEEEYELPGTYKKQKKSSVQNSLSILGNDVGPGYAHGGEVEFCSQGMAHHPDCEYYAKGGDVERNQQFNSNPELSLDHAVANHGLIHLLTKTGHSKSEDRHRGAQEFIDHSKRGHSKSHSHVHGMFEKKSSHQKLDDHSIRELKKYIDDLHMNPDKILNIGGNLSESMPDHSGLLAAKASTAASYLSGLKPMGNQVSPFDKPMPPSKMEENAYDRQLKIAEQPLSILGHINQGTVNPSDIQTLQTIYPELSKSILEKTFEKVADAKQKGEKIPYKHRIGLSAILGPLDSTQTPAAMQAIIMSAAGKTATQSQGNGKGGPTAQTQKTIEKTNKLYETQTNKLQMDNK